MGERKKGDRRGSGRLKRILTGLLAVSLLSACGQAGEEEDILVIRPEENEISYSFGVAEIGDVIRSEKVTCTYRQTREQKVCFSVSGRLIEKVYVREKDSVKRGDLLAELSGGSLDRQIETLEYRIARNELLLGYVDEDENLSISGQWVNYLYYSSRSEEDGEARDKRISKIRQNSRYRREDLSDAIETDKKELEKLRQELQASRIYAEMDGVIQHVEKNLEGSTSRQGEAIMTVIDTSECIFEAHEPELAGYFEDGKAVSMSLGYGSAGQYRLLPWHMDQWGEYQFFIISEGPENGSVTVGKTGNIVVVTDSREQVLCVPKEAIHSADGREFVYVLGADNLREVRWVETGLYGNSTVEIRSGLSEGEKVVLR